MTRNGRPTIEQTINQLAYETGQRARRIYNAVRAGVAVAVDLAAGVTADVTATVHGEDDRTQPYVLRVTTPEEEGEALDPAA